MNLKKLTGIALATAAAGLFVTATVPAFAAKHEGNVNCMGVNGCKGQERLRHRHQRLQRPERLYGKGMMEMSAKDCTAKKGTYEMKKTDK